MVGHTAKTHCLNLLISLMTKHQHKLHLNQTAENTQDSNTDDAQAPHSLVHGNSKTGVMSVSNVCLLDTRIADALPAVTCSQCHHIDHTQSWTHQ